MIRRLILSVLVLTALATTALAQVRVEGYTRRDGTYVQPHSRSAPDSSRFNNYSSQGNVNPYTGQVGTRNPSTIPSTPWIQPTPSTPWNR